MLLYKRKILLSFRSNLPVIVVGNITVGGNGKTPVVIALVNFFQEQGIACAVLSRGYGAKQKQFPHLLMPNNSPILVGDEPALISRRLKVPVVIDPKRARGAKYIEDFTDAQLIICDDGLQHYALCRDIELCVMDKRGVGNGFLLPMGPMRESTARLSKVDWLIYNGDNIHQHAFLENISAKTAVMSFAPLGWINVKSGEVLNLDVGIMRFNEHKTIAAIAGIGDPTRFFSSLINLKINVSETKAFADHYAIKQADIPRTDIVIMTEKDAVKCKAFATDSYWYLQIAANLPDTFYDYLQQNLVPKLGQKI